MIRKIALEEHFMAPDFVDYWSTTFGNISPELSDKALGALSDFGGRRLDDMDRNGIEFAVLGLAGPGVVRPSWCGRPSHPIHSGWGSAVRLAEGIVSSSSASSRRR